MEFKDKINKDFYLWLKTELKFNSAVGSALRVGAEKQKGIVRHKLREKKRDHGQTTRRIHLALCFLRGRKYAEVEPNVSEENMADSDWIRGILRGRITKEYEKQIDNDLNRFFGFDVEEENELQESEQKPQRLFIKTLVRKLGFV